MVNLCIRTDGATPRSAASHYRNAVTSAEPISLGCFN